MRNKLNFLVGISLKRKIKSKWFLVANIIIALVVIALINIDAIIGFFGGDFNNKQTIYIIDNANVYTNFKENLVASTSALDNGTDYEILKSDKSLEELKKIYDNDSEKAWIIEFNNDPTTVLKTVLISKDFIETVDYQLIYNAINNTKTMKAIEELQLSNEEINKLYSQAIIERVIIDESKDAADETSETLLTNIFPVLIMPFFILNIFLVQMIGSEVNDEKTTKSMEIIISSVSPVKHFFSKVIAGNLFILIQGTLLVLFVIIGLLLRKYTGSYQAMSGIDASEIIKSFELTGLVPKLIYIIPILLILMFLTFIAYSLLAGILASMTTNTEDFQQLQTPIMLISLAGYYLALMTNLFKGSLFIKIVSYFPFISAILSPSLLITGDITVIDFIISCIIMVGVIFLLIRYGLRIYKVGILNYSSKDLWKKMVKALKEK
ncbi:MAG: ABC transporter permease [Erysipelotrichaceae bacterium]|nr:ABC transporter permease [Erysipelotrichaceae bacterium]